MSFLRALPRVTARLARPTATIPASSSLIAPSVSALAAPASVRCFGAYHVPVGPRSNINGVYYRPNAPEPSGPLSEDDELTFDDAQAPEPLLDQFPETDRWEALGKLSLGLFLIFGVVPGVIVLSDPESRDPQVPREFPFDNLRLSRGGPDGAPIKKE